MSKKRNQEARIKPSRREQTTPSSGKNSGNSTAACSCSVFFRSDLDRDISSRDSFYHRVLLIWSFRSLEV